MLLNIFVLNNWLLLFVSTHLLCRCCRWNEYCWSWLRLGILDPMALPTGTQIYIYYLIQWHDVIVSWVYDESFTKLILKLNLCQYPNAKITGISNSHSQREYILAEATRRGLNVQNITIVTCNVSDDKGALDVVKGNDLVMTVEMFEHMKNYSMLLEKIHGFLKPGGKLFVHIFTHKDYTYHFEDGWMADNFFTGGTMPSDDMLLYFCQDFAIVNHWRVNGSNYEKTSNGWLDYLDKNWGNGKLSPVLREAYGEGKEREWYVNWRLFFLACAELWGFRKGEEWIVSHYLFERK